MRRKEVAMIELTEAQSQALAESTETPPTVLDPLTKATYVLVDAGMYERMQAVLEEDGLDMRQVAVLVERAMRADDAEDPGLESYQKYRNPS
jgi:hypothetical protein